METSIAFIGIGSMGYGMASNIRKKSPSDVTLYIVDPNADTCKRFVEEFRTYGPIVIEKTARDAASKALIVMSMVPNPADARKVHLDKDNGTVAAPADPRRLILDSSTIDPSTSKAIGAELMVGETCTYMDTPVAGGVIRAATGELTFMVGHKKPDPENEALMDRVYKILDMMVDEGKIHFCGKLGAGLATKIADNYLSGTFCVAISQAMAMGIRNGVEKKVLFDVIQDGTGQSWMGDNHQPVPGLVASAPSSHDYDPSFRHVLMIKDLKFGIEAAENVGVEPTLARGAVEVFERAMRNEDLADRDYTSVYQLYNPDSTRKGRAKL